MTWNHEIPGSFRTYCGKVAVQLGDRAQQIRGIGDNRCDGCVAARTRPSAGYGGQMGGYGIQVQRLVLDVAGVLLFGIGRGQNSAVTEGPPCLAARPAGTTDTFFARIGPVFHERATRAHPAQTAAG